MKRLLALILSLMLLLSGSALAQDTDASQKDSLVVGSLTQMSGDFFCGLWSNNTADMDVRTLLHDAATVAWTSGGQYAVNDNIVLHAEAQDAANGDRTYTFKIRSDMQYSDGSKITAKDYVFSVLLLSSPELLSLSASNKQFSHLVGWEAYAGKEGTDGQAFSGVRLLSDDSFSLTVSADYLPYFYEMALVNVTPYPMSVIAPGCDVRDDGQGAYISGAFTAELLSGTLLDEATGYVSHPSVTSGAYKLVSYENDVAKFEINPCYMGNFEGQKPSIRYLEFRAVKNDELLAQLESGEIDIANKVSSGAVIQNGLTLYQNAELAISYYLRAGFSFIAFACEQGRTASEYLRKAVALSMDSRALCDEFLLGYGQPVYGYYGYGQWMASEQVEALEALNIYEKDINAARDYLVRDGWVYDEERMAYDAENDTQRYRAVNLNGDPLLTEEEAVSVSRGDPIAETNEAYTMEALTLSMAIPQDNVAAKSVVSQLEESFKELGITLTVTELPMAELLQHYYRQTDRTYDMFFLASNFSYIFDPYYTYSTDDVYQGTFNTSGLKDEKLMELADEMRRVDSEDTEGYKAKWLEFQTYWAEKLPMVPLYSNIYFDFYRPDLYNYQASAYASWAAAVIYATFEAPVEEAAETTP